MLAISCALSVFAQGTVLFNNRVVGTVVTHVYGPLDGNPPSNQHGNGPVDTPAGTVDWNPYGSGLSGAGFLAQLLGAPGPNQPESSLVAASSPPTTFRTGAAAGFVAGTTATLANVSADAPVATLQMVAWDNRSGLIRLGLSLPSPQRNV